MLIVACNAVALLVLAQAEPKKQLPCGNQTRVFVMEASEIEEKVKSLSEEGYCIAKNHFLVIGGGKVILLLDKDDLYTEDTEDESEGK